MKLKGRKVISRASGSEGVITGIDKSGLRVSFTKYQDILIPFARANDLLIMDEDLTRHIYNVQSARRVTEGKK